MDDQENSDALNITHTLSKPNDDIPPYNVFHPTHAHTKNSHPHLDCCWWRVVWVKWRGCGVEVMEVGN
jgi:hypothetical protein